MYTAYLIISKIKWVSLNLGIDFCINDTFRYKKYTQTFMKPIFMYNIYLVIDLCINDRFRYKKVYTDFHETNIYVKNLKAIFNCTLNFRERPP